VRSGSKSEHVKIAFRPGLDPRNPIHSKFVISKAASHSGVRRGWQGLSTFLRKWGCRGVRHLARVGVLEEVPGPRQSWASRDDFGTFARRIVSGHLLEDPGSRHACSSPSDSEPRGRVEKHCGTA